MPDPRPARVIDAHVHLWDPARTDWYPYLSHGDSLGMGDVSGMARRFDPATHAAESEGWEVVGLVNVAAATGPHSIAETLEIDRRAEGEGQPVAIVGGLPSPDSLDDALAAIDAQMAASRFRGVRPMGRAVGAVPPDEVLRALAERDLVFDLLAHPDQLLDAARRLAAHPDLTVVVEHAGWPRSTDDAERALWSEGIDALAQAGEHVLCKLSGLAMALGGVSADLQRPWLEPVIEAFGAHRCMVASNFPVDGMHGTLDQLLSTYDEVTAGLSPEHRDALFAGTAARAYRIEGPAGR